MCTIKSNIKHAWQIAWSDKGRMPRHCVKFSGPKIYKYIKVWICASVGCRVQGLRAGFLPARARKVQSRDSNARTRLSTCASPGSSSVLKHEVELLGRQKLGFASKLYSMLLKSAHTKGVARSVLRVNSFTVARESIERICNPQVSSVSFLSLWSGHGPLGEVFE